MTARMTDGHMNTYQRT